VRREVHCWNAPETRIRNEREVRYHTNWWFTGSLIGLSSAALGTGLYGMAVANRHPNWMDPGSRGELSREAVWTSSIISVLAGLAGGTWAAWGMWSDERKGNESDEWVETREAQPWACGDEAVPSQRVTLTLHSGKSWSGLTDPKGVVAWPIATGDIADAPEGQAFAVAEVIPGARIEFQRGVLMAPGLTGRVQEAVMPVPSNQAAPPLGSAQPPPPAARDEKWLSPPECLPDTALAAKLEGTVSLPPRAIELLRGDLAAYFERPDLEASEAREAFELTAAGKELRQTLVKRQKELRETIIAMPTQVSIRRYNVLKRELELDLEANEVSSPELGRASGALGDLLPDNLEVEQIARAGKGPVIHDERVALAVDPKVGTTLYSRKESLVVWVRFSAREAREVDVSTRVKHKKRGKAEQGKRWVLSGSAIELIAVDSETQEVLWAHSLERPAS
jgi:hypothetical protein